MHLVDTCVVSHTENDSRSTVILCVILGADCGCGTANSARAIKNKRCITITDIPFSPLLRAARRCCL